MSEDVKVLLYGVGALVGLVVLVWWFFGGRFQETKFKSPNIKGRGKKQIL